LNALEGVDSPLLDSATVFQTANGNERIYIMPYDSQSVMWQLSFPMPEEEALSAQGTKAPKKKLVERNGTTHSANFSGDLRSSGFWLSCYDRELLIQNC
jgi:hypothetical protein